VQRRGKHDHPG